MGKIISQFIIISNNHDYVSVDQDNHDYDFFSIIEQPFVLNATQLYYTRMQMFYVVLSKILNVRTFIIHATFPEHYSTFLYVHCTMYIHIDINLEIIF